MYITVVMFLVLGIILHLSQSARLGVPSSPDEWQHETFGKLGQPWPWLIDTLPRIESPYTVTATDLSDRTKTQYSITAGQITYPDAALYNGEANILEDATVMFQLRSFNELSILFDVTNATNERSKWSLPKRLPWAFSKSDRISETDLAKVEYSYMAESRIGEKFWFKITNKKKESIFDTHHQAIILSPYLVQITTKLSKTIIYGLGFSRRDPYIQSNVYKLWTTRIGDGNRAKSQDTNSYHPTYLHFDTRSRTFQIVHIRNPSGANIQYNEDKSIKFSFLTGELDMYFFFGNDNAELAISLYHNYLNGWQLHPYWSFGTHITLRTPNEMALQAQKAVLDEYNIAYDSLHLWDPFLQNGCAFSPDIIFSNDWTLFGNITNITGNGVYVIPTIPEGICLSKDMALEGKNRDAFIKSIYVADGDAEIPWFVACYWPGEVYVLDYNHPSVTDYILHLLEQLETTIKYKFPGLQLIGNEVANYVRGEVNQPDREYQGRTVCIPNSIWRNPWHSCGAASCGPYPAGYFQYLIDLNENENLEAYSLSLNAQHYHAANSEFIQTTDYLGSEQNEYLWHNLNSLASAATYQKILLNRRVEPYQYYFPEIYTSSHMFGMGRYATAYQDYIENAGPDLGKMIYEQTSANILGIPNTLTINRFDYARQEDEFYRERLDQTAWIPFPMVELPTTGAEIVNSTLVLSYLANTTMTRYSLINYYYTLFVAKRGIGTIIRPAIQANPYDRRIERHGDKYLFGDFLVILPLWYDEEQWADFELPFGIWYSYTNGQKFQNRFLAVENAKTYHQIFVGEGSIILKIAPKLRVRELSTSYELRIYLKFNSDTNTYTASGKILTVSNLNDEKIVYENCQIGNCVASIDVTYSHDTRSLTVKYGATEVIHTWGTLDRNFASAPLLTIWQPIIVNSLSIFGIPDTQQLYLAIEESLQTISKPTTLEWTLPLAHSIESKSVQQANKKIWGEPHMRLFLV